MTARDLNMTAGQPTSDGASLPDGQSEVAVPLEGSLSILELPEVLAPLVGTAKSGELHVAGNRSAGLAQMPAVQGRLWFDAGRLASADVASEADLVDALVELLRVVERAFMCRPGPALGSRAATEVAGVMREAQARLAEWQAIEQVIPSQTAWLSLNPDPPHGHITLRADQWRLVVAFADSNSVETTVAGLGGGALAGCRGLNEMADAGLVTVHPAPAEVTDEAGLGAGGPANGHGWIPAARASAAAGARHGVGASTMAGLDSAFGSSR
jgi:hypothetical protein